MPKPRTVTPLISRLCNFLLGHRYNEGNRFEMTQSPRSVPPPKYSPGPHDLLHHNSYCYRDARRSIRPPEVVYCAQGKQITTSSKLTKDGRHKVPGVLWDPALKTPIS